MPGVRDLHALRELRDHRAQPLLEVVRAATTEAQNEVLLARDEEGGRLHMRTFELRGDFPVAVDVAVKVDAASEARALELPDEVFEVLGGQLLGKLLPFGHAPDPPSGARQRAGDLRRPGHLAIDRCVDAVQHATGSASNSPSATPGSWK